MSESAVSRRVSFPAGELKLEGMLEVSVGVGKLPAVIVCHPHPLYGGDMDNNIVTSVAGALVQRSMIALRFNFRGTGYSEGSHADGQGEQDDIRGAIDFLSSLGDVDPARIGLSGYSFGARVSLAYAPSDERVRALAVVSPQIPASTAERLRTYARPKLFVSGEDDQFMPASDLKALADTFAPPVRVNIISGADHFWSGLDDKAGALVAGFFEEFLK